MVKLNKKNLTNKNGFTIVEILLVIFIFIILTIGVVMTYKSFRQTLDLATTANQIINTLQLASNQTLASASSSNYGVHFESDAYVLFTGPNYSPIAPDNEVYSLPAGIEITEISLAAESSEAIFERLNASTDNYGHITIGLTSDPTVSSTIIILPSGQSGLLGNITTTDSRQIDSRHLDFDLGWSIQGATTLTLTFSDSPNPAVVENIVMAGYFDGPQSEFDWQGTISVNGNPQTIRVHTHLVDVTNTILSIHRDLRYNDRALGIAIDGKSIVTYDEDGEPTIGIFGGEMTIQ